MNAHWNQNERNMKCCRSTWNKHNNSSIHFRASLRMDFGFMLDLEYADFHRTLESDRAPQSDNHNNSNYSDVKHFDGSSYIQHGCSVQLGSDTILDTLYIPLSLFFGSHLALFLSTFPLHFWIHAGSEAVFYVSSRQLQARRPGLRDLAGHPIHSGKTLWHITIFIH